MIAADPECSAIHKICSTHSTSSDPKIQRKHSLYFDLTALATTEQVSVAQAYHKTPVFDQRQSP